VALCAIGCVSNPERGMRLLDSVIAVGGHLAGLILAVFEFARELCVC